MKPPRFSSGFWLTPTGHRDWSVSLGDSEPVFVHYNPKRAAQLWELHAIPTNLVEVADPVGLRSVGIAWEFNAPAMSFHKTQKDALNAARAHLIAEDAEVRLLGFRPVTRESWTWAQLWADRESVERKIEKRRARP